MLKRLQKFIPFLFLLAMALTIGSQGTVYAKASDGTPNLTDAEMPESKPAAANGTFGNSSDYGAVDKIQMAGQRALEVGSYTDSKSALVGHYESGDTPIFDRASYSLTIPPIGNPYRYTGRPGTLTGDLDAEKFILDILAYVAKTHGNIHVNSGRRTIAEQADAMLNNGQVTRGILSRTYKFSKNEINRILNKTGKQRRNELIKVITERRGRGSKVSDHIDGLAVDLQPLPRGALRAIKKFCPNPTVKSDYSKHIHIGFRLCKNNYKLPQECRPKAASFPVLERGDGGTKVKALQYLLTAHGYSTSADGIFGPETQSQVEEFQKSRRLSVDGVVGPQTWGQLAATMRQGSGGPAVKAIQIMLNEKRPAGLAVDGNFGSRTKNAVQSFQEAVCIKADGIVGPETWRYLMD